ncbi:MAG TPA: hypothetical protein VKA68_16810 [bacterium]|nr:hypothetical protein [bacterium]
MNDFEKVFGKYANSKVFLNDLEDFLTLTANKKEKLLSAFISSEYRTYYCLHSRNLAELLEVEDEKAHSIYHVFDFIAYKILKDNTVEEIIAAFNSKDYNKKDISSTGIILQKLDSPELEEQLTNLDIIDDEIGAINPHWPLIEFHIDTRAIYKAGRIIKTLPLALIQFKARHDDENKITMELTADDIDLIIDSLTDIKQKLLE